MRSFPRASSASEVLSIFISSPLHHSTKVNRCRHEIGRHWGESRWPPLGERRRWAVVVDGEGFGPARFGSVKLTLLSLFTRTRSSQLTAFLECMALAHCAHRRARERESRSDRGYERGKLKHAPERSLSSLVWQTVEVLELPRRPRAVSRLRFQEMLVHFLKTGSYVHTSPAVRAGGPRGLWREAARDPVKVATAITTAFRPSMACPPRRVLPMRAATRW